jgi:hypothetical protein
MLTVNGTAKDILAQNVQNAQIRIQLCNFGNYTPRVAGTALLARTAPIEVNTAADGTFAVNLYGNDVITPGGTYYTFVFLDNRKNVVQVNAYQFVDGVNVADLSLVTPYNPSVVVSAGMTVSGVLVTVPYASPLALSGTYGSPPSSLVTFDITLTGNVALSTLDTVVAGAIYTFIIVEDGVGGHTFSWPANVVHADAIDTTANAINIQSFVARADGNLYPIGPLTVN